MLPFTVSSESQLSLTFVTPFHARLLSVFATLSHIANAHSKWNVCDPPQLSHGTTIWISSSWIVVAHSAQIGGGLMIGNYFRRWLR